MSWPMRHLDEAPHTAAVVQASEVATPASGTCPACGYFNHPDASVREADDDLVYCNNCGETWRDPV
jgi:transposase